MARPRVRGWFYVAGVMLFAAVVAVVAVLSYDVQHDIVVDSSWRRLADVAGAKASQLRAWRAERLGDAAVTAAETPLMPAVHQLLAGTEAPENRRRVLTWIEAMRAQYHYTNIMLVDAAGQIRLSSGELFGPAGSYAELARDATHGVFMRGVPGPPAFTRPHLIIVVGLRAADGSSPGAMLLGIDPDDVSYRAMLTWEGSRTGEVVLLERDGNHALYLSPHERWPAAPITTRESLAASPSPIARAMRGDAHVEADDPSGLAIMAAAGPVSNSPWTVVVTMDRDEAQDALHEVRWRVWLIAGFVALMGSIGAVVAWRHQRATFLAQAQQARLEQQALRGHYEFLTRFGNDAILLLDGDGRIVEVNDRAIEWFGYSREEFLAMHVSQLRGAEAVGDFDRTWSTLKSHGSLVFETMDRRKDGSVFPVEISVRIIDVEGRQFCQSILRDISERRRADEQIRRLNRLYAVLSGTGRAIVQSRSEVDLLNRVCALAVEVGGFRLASVSLIEAGTGALVPVAHAGEAFGYIERVTLAAEGLFGQGAAGRSLRERRPVVCNDFRTDPTMAPWREEAERHGLRSSIALPLRRGGRDVGVLGLYASEPHFFDQAEAKLAEEVGDSVSFALDSLEQDVLRQRADEELRVSRERLERVLDAIDEGYWDWHPATGDVHLSARYHTMLGYVPGELLFGWDALLAMTHPEDVPAFEAAIGKVLDGRQDTFAIEHRMRCKSGEFIWVLSRGKVAGRDANATLTRIVGTQTDITERRTLEDQFRQAQKLESVGRLAGGIAHDFNNLLTVVNGYSEIVLGKLGAGDPNWAHVDAIRQAGERAAALTQQLLAFSRRQATQPRPLHLNAALVEFERLLRRLIGEELELVLALGSKADQVVADPSQLHQVVMNLVVNARDATPPGGRIVIHTADAIVKGDEGPDIVPGPYVVLAVTDTGTGMDEKTRAQIFEPFFTTKERGKGTGLGLSTVYGIVSQCGGFIRVDSQPGAGTTFAVHLPHAPGAVMPAAAGGRPARRFGSETVLLVEDQEPVRELAEEMLRALGYAVLTAGDGAEALLLAARHEGTIHVLITDVVMPGLDGRQVAERLTAVRPGTKVIYTSGYTDDVIGRNGVLGGDEAYLPKPFATDMLGAKIREVLGGVPSPVLGPSAERRTILVVDDDQNVRNLFVECLEGDFRVLQAADGEAAVEVARREDGLAVMITDLFMPKLEGVETIQAVRLLRPGLPVIAMSGAFGGQFLYTAERLGVNATLLKPVRLDVLRKTLDEVLA